MTFQATDSEGPLSPLDAAFERRKSRYVVGIDLGTTNCAVAFMDSQSAKPTIETFRIEQMVDFQTSQRSDTLPSFHYELTHAESNQIDSRFHFADGQHKSVVGMFARQRGMQMPGRCVASAKSWLCHTLVDRTSELLPWSGEEGVQLISPVKASRRYLEHIRRMWDREYPRDLLSEQEVIVTLPASFDEVARQLTIQAASDAGLPNVILIEEPQAAFYAWLHRNEDSWTATMQAGQTILVCDIGGGTTDFTLIRVVETNSTTAAQQTTAQQPTAQQPAAQQPTAQIASESSAVNAVERSPDLSLTVNDELHATYGLHRVAVGEHLMLGGDNLDLALARSLEQRLLAETPGQEQLKPRQWDALKAQCRVAKESLLGPSPPSAYQLSLPGSGTRLIENTRSLSIDFEWARHLLIDGFFGQVALDERPDSTVEGFQEFGLPFAAEPNVNKHLAAFLWEHRWAGRTDQDRETKSELQAARPDWVLFNGGVLESTQVRNAIIDQIVSWFLGADSSVQNGSWKPGVLEGNRLDLAVAQGAAYFGLVRRGEGVRIDARLARAYYLLVEDTPPQAMCIMPASAMPLDRYRMDEHPFELMVGQPVQFPLLQSSTNLVHKPGEIVPVDTQSMSAMSPIRSVLELGNRRLQKSVPVVLVTELSEIGTLAMRLVLNSPTDLDPPSWKLEFDVRGNTQAEVRANDADAEISETSQSTMIETAMGAMNGVFGENPTVLPKDGLNHLTEHIGQSRREWSPSLLREMWRFLMDHPSYRKRSAEHESRWTNMVGWCLRPGFGVAADDWRVNSTWRQVHNKLLHRTSANASETIVLWRRIAGGFTQGQQRALFQDCWPSVRAALTGGAQGQAPSPNVTIELLRLIGSLEWLTMDEKITIAEQALESLGRKKIELLHGPLLWTLGRIGARVPVYATLQQVVGSARVQHWLDKLTTMEPAFAQRNLAMYSLCLMQLSRRTNDRYRDLPGSTRERIAKQLQALGAPAMHIELIVSGGRLDQESTESIVGEALPLGFRLQRN